MSNSLDICSCGKRIYPTAAAAARAAGKQENRRGMVRDMGTYHCQICDGYHLSHHRHARFKDARGRGPKQRRARIQSL